MLTSGQGTVGATAALLCTVPTGPATLLLSNVGTAAFAYVGPGTNVSAANGFPIPAGAVPTAIPLYPGAAPQSLYAISAGGSANVGWIVTSPQGGTGHGTLG